MAEVYTQFGPSRGIDSKDYVLYMSNPEGATGKPVNLLGHSLTAPSPNLTEALVFTKVVTRNGATFVEEYVKRAAYETSRTYTIGIPSALLTPVIEKSYSNGCVATFYLIYQCPEDPIYNHFDILPSGVLSPAVEAEDLITNGTETNIVTMTAELRVPKKLRGWALAYSQLYSVAPTVALNDIVYLPVNCVGCNEGIAMRMIAVGGDGTAVPAVVKTVDRFGSVSSLTVGSATDVGQAAFSDGAISVIATRTGATLAASTAGKLFISGDATGFTQVAGFIGVVTCIAKVGNTLIAAGKTATQSAIWLSSDNGASWISVLNPLLAVGETIYSMDYDTDTSKIYFVGTGSSFLTGRLLGGSLQLSDLEANLPATAPGILYGVKVIGRNNLMIVGAGGYIAESRTGGASFFKVFAGTGDVTAVSGNEYRQVIGQGIDLYYRDASTDFAFRKVSLDNGQVVLPASVITTIRMGQDDDFNRFVAVTSKGQVIFGKPQYPGA